MSSIAQIPLQIQTPQPTSPLQTLSAVMGIRGQQSEMALRQAQTQDIQQQAQIRQRQLADQETARQWFSDPANHDALKTGDLSDLYGKMTPGAAAELQKAVTAQIQAHATLSKTQLENAQIANGLKAQAYGNLLTLPEDQRASQLPGVQNALNEQLTQAGLPRDSTDISKVQDFSDQGIHRFLGMLNLDTGVRSQAAELQAKQAAAEEAAGKGAQARAEAAKAEQETQLVKQQIAMHAALTQTPGGLENYINGSIPKEQYPAEFAAALNEAKMQPDLKGINSVIEKHSQNISELNKSIATVKAEEPTRIAEATAIAHANQQGALQNQMLSKATSEFQQSAKELGQRKAIAGTIQDVLDAAQNGSPEAARAAPQLMAGLVASINETKRINPGFAEDLGPEAGSLLTRVEGALKGGASGVNLTKSQLQDLGNFRALMDSGADQKHANDVAATNQAYKPYLPQPLQPMKFNTRGQAAGGQVQPTYARDGQGHRIMTTDGGKTWQAAQ